MPLIHDTVEGRMTEGSVQEKLIQSKVKFEAEFKLEKYEHVVQ